jgi:outer membrane protein TolC
LVRLSALAAAVVLTGCVKYHPQPLNPLRSEQQFRARTLADPGLRAFLKRADWPPPKLGPNDLAAVALYFNPDLDVARAQLRSAEAAIVTAQGRPNPTVSFGGGWTNSPESPLVFHFDPAFTLETAGKRGWRILEAQKRVEATRVALAETAWHVLSRVRSALLDYVIAVRERDVLQNEREVRAAIAAILDRRLGVGEISRPDVNVARTALITIEVEREASETQVREAGPALAAAVGLPVLPDIDAQIMLAPPVSLPLNEVQKAGLLHRADIQRGLLEYAVAEASLHREIANQYPDLQLSPGYSFDEGHHKVTFGPALPVPVLNRNRGPIAEAEGRRAEAEVRFNAMQARAIGEMEGALARYNSALVELADSDQRLIQIQEVREAAMLRAVRAGEEDQLAVAGIRLESAVASRARLGALRRVESALGSLADAVQQPLEPGPPLPDPGLKP